MDIQWPLALFTLLTGVGGWALAFVAVNEFTGKSKKSGFKPALIALIIVILGGFASVLHLTHPDRIMNALSHPTSGIFVEAALVGIISVCAVVYLILEKRQMKPAAKVFAVLAGAFGIAISFMAGDSYLMAARETWNTILLPLGYLGTAIPAGAALYWMLTADEEESRTFMAKMTLIGGVIALVTALAYSIYAGAFAGTGAIAAGCAVLFAGIAPAILGYLGIKKPDMSIVYAALVCSVAGALCYRMLMWIVGYGVYNFISVA